MQKRWHFDPRGRDCPCLLVALIAMRPIEFIHRVGTFLHDSSFETYEDRHGPKDAHDLVYCIANKSGGMDAVAQAFRKQLNGKHGATIRSGLMILRRRFVDEPQVERYQKDGPVAVARFEFGEDTDQRDQRVLRQREASDIIERLIRGAMAKEIERD